MKKPWETGYTPLETDGDYRFFFHSHPWNFSSYLSHPPSFLLYLLYLQRNQTGLTFISVPIIPVYLNEDKPNARLQDSDAIYSTRNSSFASGPSSAISDSSMDFKIGALFASKAFVQVFTIC